MTIGETIELQDCRRTLEEVLVALDHLGAGIAAIHVNAAIEQLASNLNTIEQARLSTAGPRLISDSSASEIAH